MEEVNVFCKIEWLIGMVVECMQGMYDGGQVGKVLYINFSECLELDFII